MLIAAALILTAVACLADSRFVSVDRTPYDLQMARIEQTLVSQPAHARPVSLAIVARWMQDLRGIPYAYSMEWKTPDEVTRNTVADCKAKAVVLYQRLHCNGAQGLRLVIGKRAPRSELTHTWVEWTTNSITYVLDPTFDSKPSERSTIPANSYVPYYAFSGMRKYRATGAMALCAAL